MPKVSVSVPHQHDPDEVVQRAQPYLEKIVDDFEGQDLDVEWAGRTAKFNFTSIAFKINGEVHVQDDQIQIDLDLPIAAMLFKEKIKKSITKNLTQAVGGESSSGQADDRA